MHCRMLFCKRCYKTMKRSLSLENGRLYEYYSCPICHRHTAKIPYRCLRIIKGKNDTEPEKHIKVDSLKLISIDGENIEPWECEVIGQCIVHI